ncbi:MAG: hypothetical protein Q9160_002323 [Pyrenula sp. 1 TL-2023]
MDAKPQRARISRVLGDENLPPYQKKTIHHRNKSSPALSTSAAIGGLKVAAKRTAFGDVSNTANVTKLSKDDCVVTIKEKVAAPERQSLIVQEKKAPVLSKPAQRAGLRNLWTGSAATTGNDNQPKRSNAADTNTVSQAANSRKTLTKRSTTIFKDSDVPAPVEIHQNESTSHRAPLHEILNLAPLHKAPEEPEKRKPSIPVPVAELDVKDTSDPLKGSSAPQRQEEEEAKFGPTKQAGNAFTSWQPPRLPSLAQLCQPPIRPSDVVGPPSSNNVNVPHEVKYPSIAAASDALPSRYSQVLPSEPEEYWDEEDDENYVEDGYVTARSIRSRGGDTTGAATTVLFPRSTKSVHRELAAAKQLVEATRTREDYEDEAFDTTMVAEYGEEIFTYMKELETKMLPNAHYMDNQAEITWSMRSVLMDWLVQVHHRFGLLPETLFLAVNYIDRFLSCKVVSINKLQLVGATAIFIAAKYEEINCPSVQEIVYMVDGGYSVDEILKAERFMLSMLHFELGWPGPMSFLRRISKADDYDLETRTLAKYFLEVTVMDERFVGCPPSFTSAAAHCLARLILRKGTWVR